MKKTCLTIALLLASITYAQEIAFDKLFSNSDAANYSIGHYPVSGTDGLKIRWYGGIRLETESGTGIQIMKDGNVGIGTNDPQSHLEVANVNGGKITISTKGSSASSANPKYPTLEFAGYQNSLKARITATEETGNKYGSKFSILVNDNTGATNLVERLSIIQDGKVGIGTSAPVERLDVSGNIITGASSSTEGINAFAIRYEDGSLSNWGALRSSASTYMSFGVKANPSNLGWLSSNGTLNFVKAAVTLDNEGFKFIASPAQQIPLNSPVNMTELLKISTNGNASLIGKLEAKEIKITHTPTADFVFESTYDLPKLEEVEKHIKEKKHLPEIASAKTMEKEGVNIGSFQIQLLQKVEELTLYSIDQNKQLKQLKSQNENQQQRIEQLEAENTELKQLHQEVEQLKKQFLTLKSTH
ncbi:hypothetical protein SAMN05421692_3417 [Chryseobacterium indologenes]|uniref:hypothetical protein n=1 Tax=Chryseobacterium indologenes TaxID=253 RepID=UPI0003E06157|nr:hypothetical protein [Chryseobacterium indologenes]GAE65909.1 hypothetical protein CIN01S_12_02810 [Chryseobacterium indologenes NBRC 14944]SFK08380.1 hypothetical protein SAMN05421692_3417 [Chryseobacterium indologenes]SUX49282.1 Uncharacterised protein [Chryseobacterium indologenes]